jgi:hypothetical protein
MAGATSFIDLRTVSSELLPTFREATERRGLIEADNTLHEGLAEATLWMMSYALRRLFATILVFCEPSDVLNLWEKHKRQCQRTTGVITSLASQWSRWSS